MAVSLQDVLNSEHLPTLPEVAVQVLELARQEEPDIEQLVEVIRADPAIAARILKTANSALFGLRYRASSIETAVPLLGINLVRMLVMGFTLSSHRSGRTVDVRGWYQLLWRQSLLQASAAETLAHHVSDADPANWFLAGLMQDIGRLALLAAQEDRYIEEVLTSMDETALIVRERAAFGFTHVDVSTELCRRWNLDESFVQAIAGHHDFSALSTRTPARASLSAAASTASLIVEYFEHVVGNRAFQRDELDRILTFVFGFTPDEITPALADIDARAFQTAGNFMVDIGQSRSLERILEDAQNTLAGLALQHQLCIATGMPAAKDTNGRSSRTGVCQDERPPAAWFDVLTGVYSPVLLEKLVGKTFEAAQRDGQTCGFLLIDIDNFRHLNEHYGTAFGDETLRRTASLLKSSVRAKDYVLRLGDDDFLVAMADVSSELVARVAERIRARIAGIRLSCTEDIVVSASIGGLTVIPDRRPVPVERVMAEVQKALQRVRKTAGNQAALYCLNAGRISSVRTHELSGVVRPG